MGKEYNKKMHHIHDKGYKDLYSNKEVAIDLFRNIIKEEWTKNISVDDLTLVNKSFVTADYKEAECDIVYRAKVDDTEVIFYILLEFQSSVDYSMPLRILFYTTEILREYSKNVDYKKYDKSLKIPAIIPIVLYNGNKIWDAPREFRKTIINDELFGEDIINFKYDVIDVNNDFTKEELLNNKNVTSAIFLLDQKIDVMEYLERIKIIALTFNSLSETEKHAVKHWIKNTTEQRIAEISIDILENNREDVDTMVANNAFVLTESLEKSEKRGIEKGKEEVLIKQLNKKIGKLPEEIIMKIEKINEEKLDKIAEDIFDIDSISDLEKYL